MYLQLQVGYFSGCSHIPPLPHLWYVRLPFIVEIRSVEDVSGDASSMDGWVGVEWSDDDLELGLNSLGLLRVTAQQGDCSYPLSCTCRPITMFYAIT